MKLLATTEDLDAALAASSITPILIFKHSATCGTSAMAYEEMEDLLSGPPLGIDVYLVRIQASRGVSNEIERRLRVRHESPQVLLIADGQVVWSATHYRVTSTAIRAAVDTRLTSSVPGAPPARVP